MPTSPELVRKQPLDTPDATCSACPDRRCETVPSEGIKRESIRITYSHGGVVVDHRVNHRTIEECDSPYRAQWLAIAVEASQPIEENAAI